MKRVGRIAALALGAVLSLCTVVANPVAADVAPATPQPSATPVEASLLINGEMIDFERGYIVFSSGDAFRLAPNAKVVDATTGDVPTFDLEPGVYAVASLDTTSALVTSVRVSQRPITEGTPVAGVPRRYVSAASPWKMNPDLIPRRSVYGEKLSKSTAVTLIVEVPPNTPFTDDIYMATDTSGWNPQAIRMQRIDGLHFRIQVDLAGGTEFHYLFTRGSWQTVERDKSGLERKAREFYVPGGVADVIEAQVFRWADIQ